MPLRPTLARSLCIVTLWLTFYCKVVFGAGWGCDQIRVPIVMFKKANSIACMEAGLVLLLFHCREAVDRALK